MDGWMGHGRPRVAEQIMYYKHISKNIKYFFLVVSRPPRRALSTFSEKNLVKK